MKIGGVRRLERGEPDLVAVGDPRRGARGIAVRDGRDMVRAQPAPALAERLLVAHRARHRPEVPAHQPIADRQEMLADDRQEIGGESCRGRGWQYEEIRGVAVSLKKKKETNTT